MHILMPRDELLRALTRAASVAPKKSANSVDSCLLLRATSAGLTVTATEKAMTYIGDFPANILTPGEVAVDAGNALQVVKVLPNDVVELRLNDNARIDVKCAKSAYKLSGQAATDFPPAPPLDTKGTLTIDAADLRKIIDQTHFSIAPDDNRYGLNGAHLDAVDTPAGRMLRMVGTDGNRLSWAQAPFTGNLGIGRRMLLPRKPLAEVRKMIDGFGGPVEIGFGERAAVVRFEGTTVHMRLLEAEFPNYKEVLPTSFKRQVTVDRAVFSESLRRVGIFAADHSVRFAFSADGLVLSSRKLDAGDAREEVPAELSGEPITMGFNAHFMQEVMSALTCSQVTLNLGDALHPCIIRPFGDDESALFVVMPVRLD